MKEQADSDTLLSGFHVLDLTDETGWLCGKILGDLGADVVKVERPGGDPARRMGPFYHDTPHPEKSLYWFAFNANKRGITLSLETSTGREIFGKLVKGTDCMVESFRPGYLDRLGLGYTALRELNHRVILTSITPFGQSGPYRDYLGPDQVVMAMGGYTALCGERAQPPIGMSFPQAYLHAGAEAAAGTMIAKYGREITGYGQQVDVSMQQCVLWCTWMAPQLWEFDKVIPQRIGVRQQVSSLGSRQVYWRCQDGLVVFAIWGGFLGARSNIPLVKWMDEEGMAPDFLKAIDWSALDMAHVSTEDFQRMEEPIAKFFMRHSKAELTQEALKRRILLSPLCTCEDVMEDAQLRDREFWQEIEHQELGVNITYPGAFVKLSGASCKIWRRAPLIGEHNEEIYEQIGLTKEDLIALRQAEII